MAGDWMKVELITPDKPEVWKIAALLKIDPDAAFGKCFRVWAWFDQHTENGHAPSVTKMLLDRSVGVTGFCDAMVQEGWLAEDDGVIHMPNHDRHNSESAKKRALNNERKRKQRKKEPKPALRVTDEDEESRSESDSSVTREEKRREEINNTTTTTTTGAYAMHDEWWPIDVCGDPPTIDPKILEDHCLDMGVPIEFMMLDVISEFHSFWRTRPDELRTDEQWCRSLAWRVADDIEKNGRSKYLTKALMGRVAQAGQEKAHA